MEHSEQSRSAWRSTIFACQGPHRVMQDGSVRPRSRNALTVSRSVRAGYSSHGHSTAWRWRLEDPSRRMGTVYRDNAIALWTMEKIAPGRNRMAPVETDLMGRPLFGVGSAILGHRRARFPAELRGWQGNPADLKSTASRQTRASKASSRSWIGVWSSPSKNRASSRFAASLECST